MFNSKSKSSSIEDSGSNATTIIGKGTIIDGNVQSSGDIRIDGSIKGNLFSSSKILIGSEGKVDGDIDGHQANILGKVNGNIKITDLLHLQGKSVVVGDVYAGKLQVDTTASFNGQCHMGANVVELSGERAIAVNE